MNISKSLGLFLIISIGFIAYNMPLPKAQSTLYLTGTVVMRSTNRPASSLWVEVVNRGVSVARSLTGDDGRYYISGLTAGSYEIVVLRSDQEMYRSQIRLTTNQTHNISL